MAHPSETEKTPTKWQHEGIEASYQELNDARVTAARKIQGHLVELGRELVDKSPVRMKFNEGRMDRYDLVFNPEDGSLSLEHWQTHRFAQDTQLYSRSYYGNNIEIEAIDSHLTESIPVTIEGHTGVWLDAGRKLAATIHEQASSQVGQ